MVPMFLAAAPMVPHAVLAEEKEILRTEGYFHVRGLYFASAPDADKMRRLEAERRVAERGEARTCAWCKNEILPGELTVEIGLRKIHKTPCAIEFDEWYSEKPTPAPAEPAGSGGENDPRWKLVTNDTPVLFEGAIVTWGSLMIQDRKTVEMMPDGSLVGGYQF